MRISRIMLIALVICGVGAFSLNCSSDSAPAEGQVVTVQRGNLTIDITAVGNLAFSYQEELTFEVSGTVGEVLVEEGESVEEGQVLAKLDTSEWEDYLIGLENQLTAEKRDLLQADINLENAEIALEKAQDVYEWPDIRDALFAVSAAETQLAWAQRYLDQAETEEEIENRTNIVEGAEATLSVAEARLEAIFSAYDPKEVAIKKLQVEQAQEHLGDAQKEVTDAQEALDEAQSTSLEINAPFDGFVTKVNAKGGDEVKKGTVAVTLADPNKFEADILVSELDILQVNLGADARVQVDAMPGLTFPAKVTHISPTATIQSGVVNYKVKVEVASLEEMIQEQQAVREEIPSQEEAEERMKQGQAAQPQPQAQTPKMISEEFQLREGLTVIVSIIIDERSDVLLVPNAAITTQGRQTFVQVVATDGAVEQREIRTGISDFQFTEVIEGLSEGEKIVVPQGTAATSTTQQEQPGGIMIPGMGGFGR